jgi:uncharacterized damage-inducible protein DinB
MNRNVGYAGRVVHPLVEQLRFARAEFIRGLDGISDADAQRRLMPMNCLSWNIGHLAWQEQRYWLFRGQNKVLLPELNEVFANGAPACTPPLDDAWTAWRTVTAAADAWLDGLTSEQLETPHTFTVGDQKVDLTFGSLLLRTIYHYWYHNGENQAIRQQLGHGELPQFVGNIDDEAPYRRETE